MHSITEETDSKNEGTRDQSFINSDIKILSKKKIHKLPPLADQINEINKNVISNHYGKTKLQTQVLIEIREDGVEDKVKTAPKKTSHSVMQTQRAHP